MNTDESDKQNEAMDLKEFHINYDRKDFLIFLLFILLAIFAFINTN